MGFGDKLKGLRDQAQQAVAENRDRIQDAVQVVGDAANTRTHGKYATKIAKVGEKVSGSVDRLAAEGGAAPASDEGGAAPASDQGGAAPGSDQGGAAAPNPVTPAAADEAASGFPEFE